MIGYWYSNEQSEGTLKYQVVYSVSSTYDYLILPFLLRIELVQGSVGSIVKGFLTRISKSCVLPIDPSLP